MKNFTDYKKGGNKGCIMESNEGVFTAVTAWQSKDFKTFKGAHNFMTKNGYTAGKTV
jgi:hypothetical protein